MVVQLILPHESQLISIQLQEVRYTRLIACGNFNAWPNFMCQCRPARRAPLRFILPHFVLVHCNINLLRVQWGMAVCSASFHLCAHIHTQLPCQRFILRLHCSFVVFFRANLFFNIVTRANNFFKAASHVRPFSFMEWCRVHTTVHVDDTCWPTGRRNTIFASGKFRHVFLYRMSKVKQFLESSARSIPRMPWLVTHGLVADSIDYDDLVNSQCSTWNKPNKSEIVPNQKDLIPFAVVQSTRLSIE